ncbi:MAG: hypothetical protein NWQ95_02195, partial [Verrucomicrobiales bacterium]|nr:hypothetical protein [Verrucomicrobiales bacterium]
MVKWLLKLIVGSRNNRVIRGIAPLVVKINEIEKELQNGPEETLREKTAAWKEHLERYTLNVETYSDRILRSREREENLDLLKRWAEKFESLSTEFRKATGFIAVNEVDAVEEDALAEKILDAQRLFQDLKDDFPAARAAYLEAILPVDLSVFKISEGIV